MSQKIISSEKEVLAFLKELKELLTSPKFDLSKDLDILMKKKNESPIDPYTTANTLLALDFDKHDVLNHLLSLELSEYMETFIDDIDNSLPPFFAFAKEIKNRDVYIKAKIRDRQNCKVFCVSFHFARYPFPKNLPYG
ncbi:MAG: hypothetical protein K0R84_729 [Clostridia bacterium]|nr:hypothetical protein [Clostridia bacterium]